MEIIGQTYLMVIEPLDFDMSKGNVIFPEFVFIFCSQSQFLRNVITELCTNCHKIRQEIYSPKILLSIKRAMENYSGKKLRTEGDFLELVALMFDLAYFTAVSHNKEVNLRSFAASNAISPSFFYCVGSKKSSFVEVIEKIKAKARNYRKSPGAGSFINVSQIVN